MGCNQSKAVCACFVSKNLKDEEIYKAKCCQTDVSIESFNKELSRFMARQQLAVRRRSLSSGSKTALTLISGIESPKLQSGYELVTPTTATMDCEVKTGPIATTQTLRYELVAPITPTMDCEMKTGPIATTQTLEYELVAPITPTIDCEVKRGPIATTQTPPELTYELVAPITPTMDCDVKTGPIVTTQAPPELTYEMVEPITPTIDCEVKTGPIASTQALEYELVAPITPTIDCEVKTGSIATTQTLEYELVAPITPTIDCEVKTGPIATTKTPPELTYEMVAPITHTMDSEVKTGPMATTQALEYELVATITPTIDCEVKTGHIATTQTLEYELVATITPTIDCEVKTGPIASTQALEYELVAPITPTIDCEVKKGPIATTQTLEYELVAPITPTIDCEVKKGSIATTQTLEYELVAPSITPTIDGEVKTGPIASTQALEYELVAPITPTIDCEVKTGHIASTQTLEYELVAPITPTIDCEVKTGPIASTQTLEYELVAPITPTIDCEVKTGPIVTTQAPPELTYEMVKPIATTIDFEVKTGPIATTKTPPEVEYKFVSPKQSSVDCEVKVGAAGAVVEESIYNLVNLQVPYHHAVINNGPLPVKTVNEPNTKEVVLAPAWKKRTSTNSLRSTFPCAAKPREVIKSLPFHAPSRNCKPAEIQQKLHNYNHRRDNMLINAQDDNRRRKVTVERLNVDDEIEKQMVKSTMMEFNRHRENCGLSPISTGYAMKFLKATDFDADGAVALYCNYMMQRKLHFDVSLVPTRQPLKAEIMSGRFTILDKLDANGSTLALFTVQRNTAERNRKVIMTSIYLQLDEALKSPQTQNNGIVLIYDFSNTPYMNSDVQFCVDIITMLKTAYPVHLRRTFIVSPPFWVQTEMMLCSHLLKNKKKGHIFTVDRSTLKQYIPEDCIPQRLGGELYVDHLPWIDQCILGYSETDME